MPDGRCHYHHLHLNHHCHHHEHHHQFPPPPHVQQFAKGSKGGSRDGGALNLVLSSPLSHNCIRYWRDTRVTTRRRQNIYTPKKANDQRKGRNPKQRIKSRQRSFAPGKGFSGRRNVTAFIMTIFHLCRNLLIY